MRWQRISRAVLALLVVVSTAIVVLRVQREPAEPPTASRRTDPDALTESVGATVTQLKGADRDFRLRYERRRTYEGGLTRLDGDVEVDVRGRAGRDFVLKGDAAEIADEQSRIDMTGHVVLEADSGFTVRTDAATYTSGDGLTRAAGPVTFESGRVSGRGVGATYDQHRDVLWLLDQADIRLSPPDEAPTTIRSGAAGFARRDRFLRFEGGVTIARVGEVLRARTVVVYLGTDEDRIELAELRDGASVEYVAPVPGGVERLAATDMNLDYGDDGRTLQRATLVGGSEMRLRGIEAEQRRRLGAHFIDATLGGDGATATALAARDRVDLEMSGPGGAMRRIGADSMEAAGSDGGGLSAATFSGAVVFRESRGAQAGTAARTIRADSLATTLEPGFGDVTHARFAGRIRIEDGTLSADAGAAAYDIAQGTLALSGPAASGRRASVTDARTRVEADSIDIALDDHSLVAVTDVRSELRAKADDSSDAPRRPSLLADDAPVNVTGDRLDYVTAKEQAVYTGNARLWQRETSVQGDVVTLDEATGNLTAQGSVRSLLPLEQTNARTGVVERSTSIATADDLVYEEAGRVATYTKNARVIGPQGDVTARRIQLYLSPTGRSLERAEAYDDVLLRGEARWATGARLTYFTADERYVMLGAPVRILEQIGADCRETIGKTLTFYKSTDTIHVDGNQDSRTQTKSGGTCPEPPAK